MNIESLTWAALALCFVLAAIALFLFLRLRKMQAAQNQKVEERLEYWRESARIVALAVVQEQCDLSEGCLRLRYILNQLGDTRGMLEAMGDELAPFATHKARQELGLHERFKQDQQRLMIEEKYRVELLD